MARHDGKIFGIGFYKTGTTSLYEALLILGYRTLNGDTPGSYPGADDGATLIKQIDAGNYRLPTFEQFDAFTDNPYFRIWRQIYELYPDAKYVLTARDERPWIDSCVKFYRNRRLRPMREWMFGKHADPSRDEESRQAWLDAYREHNAEIRQHFSSRPQQFFEFDPTQMQEWGPLCTFLGVTVPDVPWPHANATRRNRPGRNLWRRLRQALGLESRPHH